MGSATPCPPKGGLAVESNTKLHHRNADNIHHHLLTPPLAGVGSHGEERARFRAELFPARKGGGGAAIPPGPTPGGEGGGTGADAARRAEDAERALKWADERRTRKAARKGDVRAPEAATAPSQ